MSTLPVNQVDCGAESVFRAIAWFLATLMTFLLPSCHDADGITSSEADKLVSGPARAEPAPDDKPGELHPEFTDLNSIIDVMLGYEGVYHYEDGPLDESRLRRIEQLVQDEALLRQLIDALVDENSSFGAMRVLNQLYPQFALPPRFTGNSSTLGAKIRCIDQQGETVSVLVPLSIYTRFAHSYWTIRLLPPADEVEALKQELRLIRE
jgi:hypothetical protein